jgi:hypothetical protein
MFILFRKDIKLSEFVSAMMKWNKEKEVYIKSKLEPGSGKAPRKNIFITVPLEYEEEIKAYVKNKRKEADSLFLGSSETRKTELMIEFEESNPPPKRSDYE